MNRIENPFLKDGRILRKTSINRLKVMGIPGLDIEEDVKGKKGVDLVSNEVIMEYIKNNAKKLKFDLDIIPDNELPIKLNESFDSDDLEVRLTAENIARRLGRNLGYILLVLRRGDKINQDSREDYYIDRVFEEAITPKFNVQIAQEPSLISIVGAARHLPSNYESALVLDFGQTLVKRSVVNYEGEEIKEVTKLPSVESKYVYEYIFDDEEREKSQGEQLKDYMITIIKDAWKKAKERGFEPCNTIVMSIADNLTDGQFSGGGYAKLRLVEGGFRELASKKLSDATGEDIKFIFVHDGTAAADAFSGVKNSVIVTVGTALGLGFPLEKEGLRPVSEDIKFT